MAGPAYPFTAFNFAVEINRGEDGHPLVNAAFAECDGLEMSMEVKTIREGGANDRQIRLNGMVAYGQLSLKRGMTDSFDLWHWFQDSVNDPRLRANAEVVLLAADGSTELARFLLSRCVPVKLKAPAMNAKDGQIAVEELQVAYETLKLKEPGH
jgi:phage tail-like protein